MKIDIYTLLGMIKDNKAPKRILYLNEMFEYIEEEKDYKHLTLYDWLFNDYCISKILDDEVEILETTLNTKNMNITSFEIKDNQIVGTWKNGSPYHYTLSAPQKVLAEKMLEIIEVINEKDK